MTTIQDKITAKVHAIAGENGLQAVEAKTYSNLVDFHFQRPDGFETLFTIHMSFQGTHVTGGVLHAGDTLCNNTPHRYVAGGKVENIRERSFHAKFAEPGKVTAALEMVAREARAHSIPRIAPGLGTMTDVEVGLRIWDDIQISALSAEAGDPRTEAVLHAFEAFGQEHLLATVPGMIPYVRAVVSELGALAPAAQVGIGNILQETFWDDEGRFATPSTPRDGALAALRSAGVDTASRPAA